MALDGIIPWIFWHQAFIVNNTHEVEGNHIADKELCTMAIVLPRLSSYCWSYLGMLSLILALKEFFTTPLKYRVLVVLKPWDGIKMACAACPVWHCFITNVREWVKSSCSTIRRRGLCFPYLYNASVLWKLFLRRWSISVEWIWVESYWWQRSGKLKGLYWLVLNGRQRLL